jgi:hypothetical protein
VVVMATMALSPLACSATSSSSDGPGSCLEPGWACSPGQTCCTGADDCPAGKCSLPTTVTCRAYSGCTACATQLGCAYCESTGACLDQFGTQGPDWDSCANLAIDTTSCSAGGSSSGAPSSSGANASSGGVQSGSSSGAPSSSSGGTGSSGGASASCPDWTSCLTVPLTMDASGCYYAHPTNNCSYAVQAEICWQLTSGSCDCGEGNIGAGQTDSSAGWWSCSSTGHIRYYATDPAGWGSCPTLNNCQ